MGVGGRKAIGSNWDIYKRSELPPLGCRWGSTDRKYAAGGEVLAGLVYP